MAWVFKLYDVDNDGIIDVTEMAAIMETMECLETKRNHSSGPSSSANTGSPGKFREYS